MSAVWRAPVLEVYVDGVLDERAVAASCSFGYDQRYAEATVTRTGGGRGPAPDPEAVDIGYWSDVQIKLGASAAGLATRFRGWVVPLDNDLYPQTGTLHCKGKLYLAEFVRNEAEDGTDLSNGGTGMADEDQVLAVLAACGVTATSATIGGTGALLGSGWGLDETSGTPFGPQTPPTPFWWRHGESGLAYIERLDEISVPDATPPGSGGRYRTFESLNGEVHRIPLSTTPAGTPDFAFEEGVDVLAGATITRDPTGAANRVTVTGAPALGGESEEFTASAPASSPYLPPVVPIPPGESYRIRAAPGFSSPMLEKSEIAQTKPDGSPLEVISCEQVAALLLAEANAVSDVVRFATPRDDLLGPGQTVALTSPRLGIAAGERYWVQRLEVELDERGVFTQRLTAVRRV
jgi:hypothetical protein